MHNITCDASNRSPVWGMIDLITWKMLPPGLGGGRLYIQKFKDVWVRHNRQRIRISAVQNGLPPELIAGVCWIEVGGDPSFVDRVAFEVRTFDWSGPSFIDRHLTVTKHPAQTSFGAVSMQLRTAAQTLGIGADDMTTGRLRVLAACLQKDVFNIDLVARHLRQLAEHDGFSAPLAMEQVRIIGARYNRGMGLSLEQIMKNTSYGDFIVKFWQRFHRLVQ